MLQFHNTMKRGKETFTPLNPDEVKIYSCGPTVYNHVHIGNLRSFMFVDLLRRYLNFRGYKTRLVINITDVDDKIIAAANERGISIFDVTSEYADAFFKNLELLKIKPADDFPRATDHISEMVDMIKTLVEKGHAYEKEGSYYFNIGSFEKYGCLAHLDVEGLKAGARGDADEYDKENVRDFALWKAPKEGEHYWDTDIGPGRPGWHIECSAMSTAKLGNTFDIHCGGVDLVFPHHENEIAQSESTTGEEFVKYWLHCEHLIVEGRKMSKSLGNQYTLQEIIDKGSDLRAIRYLLLATHYRKKLNFTFAGLTAAESTLARLDELIHRLKETELEGGSDSNKTISAINECRKNFTESMDDDLNISAGLAALFDFVKDINSLLDEGELNESDRDMIIEFLKELDQVLDIMDFSADELDDKQILALIDQRLEARKNRDFAEADRIRDELAEKGIILQDTPQGTRWRTK
jgi:cysteinyl-tRNA synthetase